MREYMPSVYRLRKEPYKRVMSVIHDYTALKTDLKAAGSGCNSVYIQALTHKINAVETALNAFCDEERKIIHERLFDKKRFADTTAAMPDRKKSHIVQAFIHSVGCYLGEF